jgi:hypothetical protein
LISPRPNAQWIALRWALEVVPQDGRPQFPIDLGAGLSQIVRGIGSRACDPADSEAIPLEPAGSFRIGAVHDPALPGAA